MRRKKEGRVIMDTSTLLVRDFPRRLRQQIHARAALEGKFIHEVIIALLEKAVALEEKAGEQRKP